MTRPVANFLLAKLALNAEIYTDSKKQIDYAKKCGGVSFLVSAAVVLFYLELYGF